MPLAAWSCCRPTAGVCGASSLSPPRSSFCMPTVVSAMQVPLYGEARAGWPGARRIHAGVHPPRRPHARRAGRLRSERGALLAPTAAAVFPTLANLAVMAVLLTVLVGALLRRRARRPLLAILMIALAAYGVIAVGRSLLYLMISTTLSASAAPPRYHYDSGALMTARRGRHRYRDPPPGRAGAVAASAVVMAASISACAPLAADRRSTTWLATARKRRACSRMSAPPSWPRNPGDGGVPQPAVRLGGRDHSGIAVPRHGGDLHDLPPAPDRVRIPDRGLYGGAAHDERPRGPAQPAGRRRRPRRARDGAGAAPVEDDPEERIQRIELPCLTFDALLRSTAFTRFPQHRRRAERLRKSCR